MHPSARVAAIEALLRTAASLEKAESMRHYMRDQFDFLGIPAPVRRQVVLPVLRGEI